MYSKEIETRLASKLQDSWAEFTPITEKKKKQKAARDKLIMYDEV